MKLNTPIDLGRLIRDERKQRGWTQTVLADKTNLLQKDISRIENNTDKINITVLMRLCAALDIQLFAHRRGTYQIAENTLGF